MKIEMLLIVAAAAALCGCLGAGNGGLRSADAALPAGIVEMPPSCTTPDGMAVDPRGRLIVAGCNCADRSQPGCIFRIDEPGAAPVKWFDVPVHPESGYSQPMGLAFGPEGELYVCDCQEPGRGRLLRFTFNPDDSVATCETVAEGLANANGVKYFGGRLYLTQARMPAAAGPEGALVSGIYMFGANERNVKVANTGRDPQLVFSDVTRNPKIRGGLNGIASDGRGHLYTGNYGDGHVWRLTLGADGRVAKSERIVTPDKANGVVSPDGMCVDGEGRLYVADMFGGSVFRVGVDGRVETLRRDAPGSSGGLVRPSEPCCWRGSLYVANFGSTTLFRMPL